MTQKQWDKHVARNARRERQNQGGCIVAVYGVSRHCGGREEGGWYYDWTEIISVRRLRSKGKARAWARKMRAEYPTQRPDRFSVLGNGLDTYVCRHRNPDRIWEASTERPRYE